MTMTPAAARNQRRSSPPDRQTDGRGRTRAGEHARLLRDVRRRTAPVLALADAHIWPAAELHTLLSFLRTATVRQVSDEAPSGSTAPAFLEPSTDQLRLRSLIDQLDQVAAYPCTLPELTALIEELLATLERADRPSSSRSRT